jgi:hypothetical protein
MFQGRKSHDLAKFRCRRWMATAEWLIFAPESSYWLSLCAPVRDSVAALFPYGLLCDRTAGKAEGRSLRASS